MSKNEEQRFTRIIKKIINSDDSKQFFYYGLVCNALTDKVITHDEWKFIKEQLTEMGYFDKNKCYSSGVQ